MTWLPDAFDRAAQANRSRTALVEEDRSWTFGELADESDAIAAMLRERVAGDTVGILLLNSEKYVTTLLGVWEGRQDSGSFELPAAPAGAGVHHQRFGHVGVDHIAVLLSGGRCS
jgi:non-ribosomal peptide synthetase component F